MAYLLTLVCLISSMHAFAKHLGVHGHIYPIEEEDLCEYLQKRFESMSIEELQSIEKRICAHYTNTLTKPKAVEGVRLATQNSVSYFDPTVTAKADIHDTEGKIIVQKGTQYNPLTHTSLPENLLFFDGDDPQQIAWAKSRVGRWIWVKGQPLTSEERENRPIYFDQFGLLCKKLKITTIPAQVSQEDERLKIEVFSLKEAL